MVLIAIISLANAWSAGPLVADLVGGTETGDAARLLLTGGAIWAKLTMLFQSAVSLSTVVLVVARAVNTLR